MRDNVKMVKKWSFLRQKAGFSVEIDINLKELQVKSDYTDQKPLKIGQNWAFWSKVEIFLKIDFFEKWSNFDQGVFSGLNPKLL